MEERIIIITVVMMLVRYVEHQLSATSFFHLWNIYSAGDTVRQGDPLPQ